MKREYLPLPLDHMLVPAENSTLNKRYTVRMVALANNRVAGGQFVRSAAQAAQDFFVLFAQVTDAIQFSAEQRREYGCHMCLPRMKQAGALPVSLPPTPTGRAASLSVIRLT